MSTNQKLQAEPREIRRLDEAVVNRIAAGEIIQRPANALKELLENSLDAGATSISILTKQGGLQLLQISDNGSGIRKEDLNVVCERFTTSKLKEFSDLSKIATYGFRGEALASISHVAKLSILTKTKDEKCGYKTMYSDGKPTGKSTPCAANQGTSITVEDLFFNVPTRKRVLKSPSEEYNRIADVVSKYAIHNSGVGFSLKKATLGNQSDSLKEVKTHANSSTQQNIGSIYGSAVEKELLSFEIDESEGPLKFKVLGQVSGLNYNTKKGISLFFINHRLVESPAMKKAIDYVYSSHLPKGTHPFIYLSLEIAPANVDVNVHPTKHEVHFLHQDEIVQKIQDALESKLSHGSESRVFFTKPILKEVIANEVDENRIDHPLLQVRKIDTIRSTKSLPSPKPSIPTKVIAPKNIIRTDSKQQKLDMFIDFSKSQKHETKTDKDSFCLNRTNERKRREHSSEDYSNKARNDNLSSFKENRRTDVDSFQSLISLRNNVKTSANTGLKNVISEHTYVGTISREFSLIQHSTSLYIANTPLLTKQLFYQIVLKDFGNFGVIRLNPPVPINALAKLALDDIEESGWTEEDGDKAELSEFATKMLQDKSDMLDDYFSLEIDNEGNLLSIPELLEGYVPFFGGLPIFLLRLATEVNWDDEEMCFKNLAEEFARFYAVSTDSSSTYDGFQHGERIDTENKSENEVWKSSIELILYPALKKRLNPQNLDGNEHQIFVQIASLPELYKVFERC